MTKSRMWYGFGCRWGLLALLGMGLAGTSGAEEGFVPLLDGQSLVGWSPMEGNGRNVVSATQSAFSVREGMLYCSGLGADAWLRYDQPLRDFVLRLEFKGSPGANSGIFLRCPPNQDPVWSGFEVQIMDDHGKPPGVHIAGAIYDVISPMRNMCRPAGEWNQFEITLRGSTCQVVMNGFKIIDVDFAELREPIGKFPMPYAQLPGEGYFGLQNHGGELWFRNIELQELNPAEQ